MSASSPDLLRRLLERALPADVREGIVGDLDEVHAARRARSGAVSAHFWYARQVLAICARFAAERIRGAMASTTASVGLDMKLGLRMLVKYPMLTLVGGIAVTVASALGVGVSEFAHDLFAPSLPLDEGDRIVRLYQVDVESGRTVPATLHDLAMWREGVTSLQDLGAYETLEQGIVTDRGEASTLSLARMTASGFRLTRVPPQLGRFLVDADEEPGGAPVVVLGYDVWQRLLGGDPDAVGRVVQLGGTPTTVVGVMPEGYGFPQNQDAWAPLRVERAELLPGSAPAAAVFGRLQPGATLESAQVELEVAGRRAEAGFPEVYAGVSPRVRGFVSRGSGVQVALGLSTVGVLFSFLLMVACANVATLVFARTVMRQDEIAVRTSLGATRRRIVLQLLAEGGVLVGVATLLGVVLAGSALGRISHLFFVIQQEGRPPFWWNDALSPSTIAYAFVLALVGSVMVGVVPALRATRATVPRLGQLASGGGGLRFGGMWTVIIVLQVALTVAFLPLAVAQAGAAFQNPVDSGFPAGEYVTAQMGRDPAAPLRTPEDDVAFLEASRRMFDEARDRIAADPAVRGAALASGLSAMNHLQAPVEFEGDGRASPVAARGRVLLVDGSYLELMGATRVAGRALGPADFRAESRSVVVNQAFVDLYLEGRNAVGGQLRFSERRGEASFITLPEPGALFEVVGVVSNPGVDRYGPGAHPGIYAPLDLAPVTPRALGLAGMPQAPAVQLFVRMAPAAPALGGRLYGMIAGVDPALHLSDVGTAAEAWAPVHLGSRLAGWIFLAVAGIVLMLSVAGIYALMSFTVSRRTREIAIRTAVGAPRGTIVRTIFSRALVQLLAGVALGGLIAVPVLWDGVTDEGPRSLVIVSTLLLGAGVAACLLPIRRALSIDPAAAMKSE